MWTGTQFSLQEEGWTVGKSVPVSLPWGQGTFMGRAGVPPVPTSVSKGREGRDAWGRGGSKRLRQIFSFLNQQARKAVIQAGGEILGKPLAKSHRRILRPDFYIENRPLPRNILPATSAYARACLRRNSGRVVTMPPVSSWSGHRELEKSLWEQMSGRR